MAAAAEEISVSSRLSIIQEQIPDPEICSTGSVPFDDLRRDYKDAIQCIIHCETLIKTLESQLTTKDDIISSLEEKLVSMSLELAKAKANEDELELSYRLGKRCPDSPPPNNNQESAHSKFERRCSLPVQSNNCNDAPTPITKQRQRASWSVEDDASASDYGDDDVDDESPLNVVEEDEESLGDSLGGVEDAYLPPPQRSRKIPDKRKRPELGRTKSTPIAVEDDDAPPKQNERPFAKSLPNGGLDESTYDDYEWESARSNLNDDESSSSRGFLGIFGRSRRSSQESDHNDSGHSGMDMSNSDRGGGGDLDESISNRGWNLFHRKKNLRRASSLEEEEEEEEEQPKTFEQAMNDVGRNNRRGPSQARLLRTQKSNRNFLSAVCFPEEDDDDDVAIEAGCNDRSFVKHLKVLQEEDTKAAVEAKALSESISLSSIDLARGCADLAKAINAENNISSSQDDDQLTAIQRTIARREALKKQRRATTTTAKTGNASWY